MNFAGTLVRPRLRRQLLPRPSRSLLLRSGCQLIPFGRACEP
jgi:hypothetical protein